MRSPRIHQTIIFDELRNEMRKAKKQAIFDLVIDALCTDGEHHKQWYLEEILKVLGYNPDEMRDAPNWEKGIAP